MIKININIVILLLLNIMITKVVNSTPTCIINGSPSYCPFSLLTSSDIPSAASSYNVLNKQKYMNNSIMSFQTVHDLLAQITDPILNASTITPSIEALYNSAVSLTTSHVDNWVTILNNYYRVDVLGPTSTYQTNYNTITSMKSVYLPLYNQGMSVYNQITVIQNNLNGAALTSTQTAQLSIYSTVKNQLVNLSSFFNSADLYLNMAQGYAVDLNDLPNLYSAGDCEIDSCREALITYNEFFTQYAYDFYLSRDSLNQLNI